MYYFGSGEAFYLCLFIYWTMLQLVWAPKPQALIFPILVHSIVESFSIQIYTTLLGQVGLSAFDDRVVHLSFSHSRSRAPSNLAQPPSADHDDPLPAAPSPSAPSMDAFVQQICHHIDT